MATTTTSKIEVKLKLNNGSTTTGTIKTVSLSIGKLSVENFDLTKAYNVAELLRVCLDKSVYEVIKTETSRING